MSGTKGNFFYLHNEIFALGLPPSAFMVYCYLQRCADRKTRQCYPSYTTISDNPGFSVNTVQRAVRILADKGLIFTENTSIITRHGVKHNGTLLYTVLDPRPVIEAHHLAQLDKLELETERWNREKRAAV